MTTAMAELEQRRAPRSWTKRYPPLVSLLVALVIAIVVLPSALRLPQTNPTQTAEFAPVPPDDKTPPNKGNVSALGLGNQATIDNAVTPGPGPGAAAPLPPPAGSLQPGGKTPTTKLCVRDRYGILRETDDPLSPPCVADFRGDNFGPTYQGVSQNEVRILVYLQGAQGHINDCGRANETSPVQVYVDLAKPPDPNQPAEGCELIALRGWQKYFNDRFQTYNRFVHFFAFFSSSINSDSSESRRADAADNYATLKPFAVISYVAGNEDDYLSAMVERHVLNFGSFVGKDEAFFNSKANRTLVWSYTPSQQKAADDYVNFICTKVANKPVSFSGNTADMGKPRKYGMLSTTDGSHPELTAFHDLVKSRLSSQCNVQIAQEATYPRAGYAVDAVDPPGYAAQNMAAFKSAGITTILWPGGLETKQSGQAQALGYLPEWIVAGDSVNDGQFANTNQGQTAWAHAWIISYNEYQPAFTDQICYQAFRSVDPSSQDRDAQHACDYYPHLRQLFTGIQVAGPRLTPTTIDQGFHAIPPHSSTDPRVPACFYGVDDFTCIKDAAAEWWDPTGNPPGSHTNPGCWRMAEGGKRYLATEWPPGDVPSMKHPADPCNGYGPTEQTLL